MRKILEKKLNTLEKCCEETHQNDKSESKSKDEVKKILASTLKISVDTIELSDNVISIKGNSTSELYIDDIEIDAVLSLGNLEDKEDIHTIFVKYDFEFGYCIFKNINLSTGLECQNLSFSDCHFNNEVNLSLSEFKSLSFSDCHFNNEVNLSLSEFKSLSFSDCHFNNEVNFSSAKSKERTSFKDCKFKDEVDFTKAEFENNDFGNIFCSITFEKKVDFTQFKINQDINDLTFRDEVIFDNTEFLKEIILSRDNFILEDVNFEECIFDKVDMEDGFLQEKNISFKSCQFKKIIAFREKNIKNITFGTCAFEQGVYFVSCVFSNANFYNCNFNNAACFYGSTFNMAPNFSQSVFKDSPNLVNIKAKFDFQNLNTTIENIYKPKDEAANDFRDSFRNFKSVLIKDSNLLDASNFHKYELYCKELELKFKKLKIFSREWIDKWQLFFYRKLCDHHTDILQSLNSLILVIGIFVLSSVVMVANFNYRLGYKPILEHWYFSLDFYNHHINSIIQDNYLFVVKVNFAMLFGYLILVGFALCLKYIREFFIIISYAITLFVLMVSPKILIPAMGIFTDKRAMLDPLSTIGGIYTIVFGFVVFSFIKTIRKNSIVPS